MGIWGRFVSYATGSPGFELSGEQLSRFVEAYRNAHMVVQDAEQLASTVVGAFRNNALTLPLPRPKSQFEPTLSCHPPRFSTLTRTDLQPSRVQCSGSLAP